jgi:hypothetical protein
MDNFTLFIPTKLVTGLPTFAVSNSLRPSLSASCADAIVNASIFSVYIVLNRNTVSLEDTLPSYNSSYTAIFPSIYCVSFKLLFCALCILVLPCNRPLLLGGTLIKEINYIESKKMKWAAYA